MSLFMLVMYDTWGVPRDPANDLCSGSRGHCPGIARGFYSLIFLLYFLLFLSPMSPRSSLLLLLWVSLGMTTVLAIFSLLALLGVLRVAV
jgi:hypothetical protein